MYAELLRSLTDVPAFRALSFRAQDVPKPSAVLHPPFERVIMIPAAHLLTTINRLTFREFTVEGASHLRRLSGRPVIFVCNHQSYLDAPLVGAAVTRYFGRTPWFMAKKRLWKELHYRLSFGFLGALPFARRGEDPSEHIQCLRTFIAVLKAGEPLILYPEGTIPGEVETAHKGLFKLRSDVDAETGLLRSGPLVAFLALMSGAAIVPIGLSGAGKVLPPEIHPGAIWTKRKKRDHVIRIRFGEPIAVDGKWADLSAITDEGLGEFTRRRIMPALSRLIDFSLHEVPVRVPLTDADYGQLRQFERNVAEEYRQKGKTLQADMILKRLVETP